MSPATAAFDVLRAYFEAKGPLPEEDFALMRELCVERSLRAGEFLLRAGEVARYAAFVASGCLRSFVIDAKGREHVVQFAPETWWLADAISLHTGAPSQYFMDAIEETTVLLVDGPAHLRLVADAPSYATAFHIGIQKHVAAKDTRIVKAMTTTAEERYLDFLATYPSIANRVPQWMLASYLGVSAETVSRVRKNRSRR